MNVGKLNGCFKALESTFVGDHDIGTVSVCDLGHHLADITAEVFSDFISGSR